MKKSIKNRLNALMAAAIVLLGFGSCHTVRPAADENGGKQQNEQNKKNDPQDSQDAPTVYEGKPQKYIEPQPVVYGPPPRRFSDSGQPVRK